MSISNASVFYSKTKGYLIKLNDTQLWASNIPSSYVCGNNGRYIFTSSPDFRTAIRNDSLGTLVVFAIGVLITIAITATWPLLISISVGINKVSDKVTGAEDNIISYIKANIVDKMENKDNSESEDEEEEDEEDVEKMNVEKKKKKRRSRLNIFTIIWMSVAGTILLFVSVLVSQLLCYNMRWRNIYRKEIINNCYELSFVEKDKNLLDEEDGGGGEGRSFSRGNNVDLKYYRENDTAVFTLKAQIGTYYADGGKVMYDFNPTTSSFMCKRVPAIRLEEVTVGNKRSSNSCYDNTPDPFAYDCGGSFSEEEDYGWENVKDDNRNDFGWGASIIAYDSKYNDKYKHIFENYIVPSYGATWYFKDLFLKAPSSSFGKNGEWCSVNGCQRTKVRILYGIKNWSLCTNVDSDETVIARRTEDSKSEMLDIGGFSHLVNLEFPYGYYEMTDGISDTSTGKIARKGDFKVDSVDQYLVFNDGEIDENYIISEVLHNIIEYAYGEIQGWLVIGDWLDFDKKINVTRSDSVTYTLHNASRFSDFHQPCSSVHAYDEVVDNVTRTYVQSDDTVTCYLDAGWSDGETQLVILSPKGAQDVTGALTWSCITDNENKAVGLACGQAYRSLFETPLQKVTSGIRPTSNNPQGNSNKNNAGGPLGSSMSNKDGGIVNGKITTKKLLVYVTITVGCLAVVVIIAVVIRKAVKKRKKKNS